MPTFTTAANFATHAGTPHASAVPAAVAPPARRGVVVPAYYLFTLSALVLVPPALALRRLLARGRASALLDAAAGFGVATALFQTLGFMRWTIAVPYLADVYADPRASAATRDAAVLLYGVLNRYLGMSVGEHLGWLAVAPGTRTVLSAAEQFGAAGWWVTASFQVGYVGFVVAAGAAGVHFLRHRRGVAA